MFCFQFERLRREREKKKKEQALTLEETKSEIARLEKELILHKVFRFLFSKFFLVYQTLCYIV